MSLTSRCLNTLMKEVADICQVSVPLFTKGYDILSQPADIYTVGVFLLRSEPHTNCPTNLELQTYHYGRMTLLGQCND